MKKIICSIFFLSIGATVFAQDNVGIGTTTPNPNAILELQSGGSSLGLLLPREDISTFTLGLADAGMMVYNTGDNKVYTWNGTGWTSGTSEWGVNGTNIYNLNTGNVGIGINSPTSKLHVLGSGIITDRLELTGTNDANGIVGSGVLEVGGALRIDGNEIITNSNTSLSLQNDNNGDLRVDNGTFVVDASANRVGIGISNPSAELHIFPTDGGNGDIAIGTTGSTSYWNMAMTNGNERFILAFNNGSFNDYLIMSSLGNMGVGSTFPINRLDVEGGAAIGASYAGTNLAPTNGLIVESNLGVGTPSPSTGSYKIHAHSTGTASLGKYTTAATGTAINDGFNLGYVDAFGGVMMVTENAGLRIGTNSLYHSITDVSGNWGFGTLTPQNRVDIEGGVAIGSSYSGSIAAPANGLLVQDVAGFGTSAPGTSAQIRVSGSGRTYGINASTSNTTFSYAGNFTSQVSSSGTSRGVYAVAENNGTAASYGVYGVATGSSTSTKYGIFGSAGGSGTQYGVYCSGNGAYTGTWVDVSDPRFKRNIQPMEDVLDKVLMLEPKSYQFQDNEVTQAMGLDPEEVELGLISTEVEQVFPELVEDAVHPGSGHEGENGSGEVSYKGMNYIGLTPVLVKAIQEQQEEIEELKERIAELEAR